MAREIRKVRPELPIILATGYLRPGDGDAARQAGIREILDKPITPQEMLPVIDRPTIPTGNGSPVVSVDIGPFD